MFPDDFIIMEFSVDEYTLILLEIHFLATVRTLTDSEICELSMRVNGQRVIFNVLNDLKYPLDIVKRSLISIWD